ncbi:major tail protein with Ig-like domain [Ralstonia phage PQ43W]
MVETCRGISLAITSTEPCKPDGKKLLGDKQAEPGADERVAFDEKWRPKYWALAALLATMGNKKVALVMLGARAAQSGQRAGVAEDARDAARYRWLREESGPTLRAAGCLRSDNVLICGKHLDEAVDRAIAAAAPTQQQENKR